jgi:SAM-dependent methyltransferase
MSDILKYYEDYQKHDGYKMASRADTSRILSLQRFIKAVTPPNSNILDIGCGDMWLATQLPEYNWVGLDAASDYSNGKAIVHDIMTLPYPVADSSIDTVVCSEVLEHVWTPQKIHHEAYRTLKSGGHYIISTPNFNNLSWVLNNHKEVLFEGSMSHHYEHIRWYTLALHKKFLKEAGFQIVASTGADAHEVDFFQIPRSVLYHFLNDNKLSMSEGQVDQLLGQMFPEHCATIMIVAKKV